VKTSHFTAKTFENLTLEILYPNQSILVSNIYHSPNSPVNVSLMDHSNNFLELLDSHLNRLSSLSKDTYIFLDANIDLLKLNSNNLCSEYMDVNLSNGFVQLICKATRIQGAHFSLIDHIWTNTNLTHYKTGTIISDISDHFINFIELNKEKVKLNPKLEAKRKFSHENLTNFKETLSNLNWDEVCSVNDVDRSFDLFWNIFYDFYKTHFPLTKSKFNKNIHKINNYMTQGLLISRATKINLHKIAVKDRSQHANENYKKFRNIYNTTLRASKKMYFDKNFELNRKNPKRTWDLLKEATNLTKSNDKIHKLQLNNQIITEPKQIANAFNNFFVRVGADISESIIPTKAKAEDFMPVLDNIDELDLGDTSPIHFIDIIKSLQSKSSMDSDGISTNF